MTTAEERRAVLSSTGVTPSRLLLVGVALTVLIVVLLMLEAHDPTRTLVTSVDRRLHRAAVAAEGPFGLLLAHTLSFIGSVYVTAPLRIAVGAVFAWQRRWSWVAAWVLSIAIQEVAITSLKAGFDRPRPSDALEAARQAAFPSGHAGATAVTVVTLLLLLPAARRAAVRWWSVGAVVIALMSASRIYLRVHWPSDVLMGALVGGTAAVLAVGLVGVVATWRRGGRRPDPDDPLAVA